MLEAEWMLRDIVNTDPAAQCCCARLPTLNTILT
jgi:hypothetical protein